ncbi:hypothetical protein J4219_01280 [Candidatus Woesearchaeota archaeon]|nr:hypothetical protein [Candidatus Woesearchaeota archaeon]
MNEYTRNFLIGLAATVVLAFLVIVYAIPSKTIPDSNVVEYNYFTFTEVGGLWETNIDLDNQLYSAIFRYNPKQVEDVYITGNFTGFKKDPIYITFDPDSDKKEFPYLALATTELSLHLIRALNFSVEAACTKNLTDACIDRPIVTCDSNESVIYLLAKAPTQITLDKNCATLSGEGLDLLKSVDRLLFQWYKIFAPLT